MVPGGMLEENGLAQADETSSSLSSTSSPLTRAGCSHAPGVNSNSDTLRARSLWLPSDMHVEVLHNDTRGEKGREIAECAFATRDSYRQRAEVHVSEKAGWRQEDHKCVTAEEKLRPLVACKAVDAHVSTLAVNLRLGDSSPVSQFNLHHPHPPSSTSTHQIAR